MHFPYGGLGYEWKRKLRNLNSERSKNRKCGRKCQLLSHVQLFVTLWTIARQVSLSMGFPRQEYWSGLLFPSLGDLPNPGIEPRSPALREDSSPSEPLGKP